MNTKGMHGPIALVVTTALVLAACGSGSHDMAGIDRTGAPVIAAYGPVSAFGSVVVNGVRYDTSSATFTIDDESGTQADLSIGDIVLVKGSLDSGGTTGTAASVSFENDVVGPVTSIDAAAGTLVVLGQSVRVSADTSFDSGIASGGLDGLTIGDVLEVSGLVHGDQWIDATRIARRPAGGEFEVTGTAAGNQVVLRAFFLGGLFVNYRAAVVSGIPGGIVSNGQRVRIKGVLVSGAFSATQVSARATNPLGGASGERRDIEGAITRFASATDFDVAGLKIAPGSQTRYDGGTAADLGLGVTVEAEGTLNEAGALSATRIELRRSASARITGSLDSVNAAGGSLVVLGVTANVNARTRLEDQGPQKARPFSLANLVPGDYVEVRGSEAPAGSGQLLATLVERRNNQQQTELEGIVESVTPPLFVVLGVSVSTDAGTQFGGIGGVSQLAVGDRVKIDGQKLGDRALAATKVSIGH